MQAGGEGLLSITTHPWSVIIIDGKKVGNSPQLNLKLKAGPHDIKLVNEAEGIDEKLRVVIEAGKETRLVRKLKVKTRSDSE